MQRNPFNADLRTRFLAMVEVGVPVGEACARTPVPGRTMRAWLARGRKNPDSPEGDFARRYDLCRTRPLTKANLLRMLERAALAGNVRAVELLLRRPWRQSRTRIPVPRMFDLPGELQRLARGGRGNLE